MHRLLIADDEPKIRRRLSQLIDWNALGVEVVAFADNGRQALEMALEADIDLCMVDVRMPVMNGLDLIQNLGAVKPGVLCIIISGHDEFEYAQRAISLNVFDYLLKPINSEILERTIRRAVQELDARSRFEELRAQSMELLHRRLSVLREDFLREILSGMLSEEEIHQRIGLLEMHARRHLLAMISLEPFLLCDMRQEDTDFRLQSQILRNEVLKALPQGGICTTDSYENIVALVPSDDLSALDLETALLGRLQEKIQVKPRALRCMAVGDLAQVYGTYVDWRTSQTEDGRSRIQDVVRYLEEHFSDPTLNMSTLTNEFHISSSYLTRLFRRETGLTFLEYLIRLRIRQAIRFLDRTDMKIYEIAERVGYTSQHYFCTAFKQVLGVSPTEYRSYLCSTPKKEDSQKGVALSWH